MARVVLSEGEKTFIIRAAEKNHRTDGRRNCDYRTILVETGTSICSNGSSRVKLANTDVIVGIKTEIQKPDLKTPNQGKIEFSVDCSGNADIAFEGRGGDALATELAAALANTYDSPLAFDLTDLCILSGQHCWKIYVDIMILECGGNLYDAVSLATKAALFNVKIPRVTASLLDAGESELTITDNIYDCSRINVESVPIIITVSKIGDACVVDPTAEEELCATATIIMGITIKNGKSFISSVQTAGKGSLNKDSFDKCVKIGCEIAEPINSGLMECLKLEEERLGMKRENPTSFLR
ncbi:exosome complex component RRP42-like [Teleopsis dalmanni]|uniref:exosome complex component RRP42-like n=1 Tax=Teleopsis dalmanni TaxID=139649 RepID=UPI000D32CF7F|nr:exosome complex component RRP42-like [Teleopsis dalmanni]XP_037952926.1 exosome complex component RRP42-like [Teleopsis dalmanni]